MLGGCSLRLCLVGLTSALPVVKAYSGGDYYVPEAPSYSSYYSSPGLNGAVGLEGTARSLQSYCEYYFNNPGSLNYTYQAACNISSSTSTSTMTSKVTSTSTSTSTTATSTSTSSVTSTSTVSSRSSFSSSSTSSSTRTGLSTSSSSSTSTSTLTTSSSTSSTTSTRSLPTSSSTSTSTYTLTTTSTSTSSLTSVPLSSSSSTSSSTFTSSPSSSSSTSTATTPVTGPITTSTSSSTSSVTAGTSSSSTTSTLTSESSISSTSTTESTATTSSTATTDPSFGPFTDISQGPTLTTSTSTSTSPLTTQSSTSSLSSDTTYSTTSTASTRRPTTTTMRRRRLTFTTTPAPAPVPTTPVPTTIASTLTSVSTISSSSSSSTSSSTSTMTTMTARVVTTQGATTLSTTSTAARATTTPSGREQAQATVAAVEAAEEALLDQVLASPSEGSTVTVQTDVGVSAAKVMSVNSPEAEATGRVSMEVEGTGVSVTLSVAALEEVGVEAVSVVTVMNESSITAFKAADVETELLASPVNVRLVDLEGNEISVRDLVNPIEIVLNATRTQQSACAYWDEVESRWIVDELDFAEAADDTAFICVSSHLTIFGAVLKGFLDSLACSNAHVLTADGVASLGDGDWASGAGSIFLILLIIVEFIIVGVLTYLTRKQCAEREWEDELLFTEDEALTQKKGIKESLLEMLDFINPRAITTLCARHTLAYEQSVDSGDLKTILQMQPSAQRARTKALADDDEDIHSPQTGKSAGMDSAYARAAIVDHVVINGGTEAVEPTVEAFFRFSFRTRVWILFLAVNAWFSLQHFSFSLPSSARGWLLICRMQGSLFVNALYFSAGAQDKNADPECDTGDIWRKLGQVIGISIVSFIIGSFPYILLLQLSVKELVYDDGLDDGQRRWHLIRMKLRGWISWLLAVGYWFFCTFFLFCFLANVAKGSQGEWVGSAIIDLTLSILLVPLGLAFVLACVATWATMKHDDLLDAVLRAFGVHRGDDLAAVEREGIDDDEVHHEDLRHAADHRAGDQLHGVGIRTHAAPDRSDTPRSEGSSLGGVRVEAAGWGYNGKPVKSGKTNSKTRGAWS